jgi:hypothetical protein
MMTSGSVVISLEFNRKIKFYILVVSPTFLLGVVPRSERLPVCT